MKPKIVIIPLTIPTMVALTLVIILTIKVNKKFEFMKGIKYTTSVYGEFTDTKKWYD